jgi:DNA (cytosine-5)-methyltransferase 1
MENVSGMTSFKNPDEKPIVQVIKKEFEDIGYRVKIDVLNAAKYGVPQNRKRIFFLGWKPRSKVPKFPEKKSFEISSWDAIRDLPPAWIDKNENVDERKNKLLTQLGPPNLSTPSLNFLQNMRESKNPNNSKKSSNITSLHRMRKVNPRDIGIFPLIKSGEFGEKVIFADLIPEDINFPPPWKWNKTKGTVWNGKTNKLLRKEYRWYDPGTFADKMRRIRGDKPAPTIVAHLTHDGYMFIHPRYNRTITVREAARLQSFPDSFDFSADGKVPWSKQFKQVGNAVPPNLSKEIGLMIIKNLK